MPLKWLLFWQPNAGTTVNTQVLGEITQCVESINTVKGGRWKNTLNYYRPNSRDQSTANLADYPRDLMGITLQEQPDKYYFIIHGQRIVVEADTMIPMIMEKLQSYRARVSINFEGYQYQLGDFQLRVGKMVTTTADSLKGIVMEMEYLPISSLDKSRHIMEEFLDMWQEIVSRRSMPGRFMHIEANFAEYGLPDNYTSHHSVVQYGAMMNHLLSTGRN
ncbi:hypothetical protein AQUCO_07600088v1 [Aquilegia coerulea]|uniref:Mediator of RNA polymerase II transcription subunit 20 n=1 Tax=Aquilegia coerulea TaxID=218851 RepID=A0A2G5C8T6_AQUCA|nr:hypothetical protein AQUCO_07600088v1 [Aquilegia coerulea]